MAYFVTFWTLYNKISVFFCKFTAEYYQYIV